MKKVLLAIDGVAPDKKAFQYAVQLCRRITAELNVLQVIGSKNYGRYISRAKNKTKPAKRYVEGAFMAVAFAEAGEHETADALMSEALQNLKQLLPESEKEGIRYHVTMKAGNLKREIVRYLREHRDVVLTVYDARHRKGTDAGFAKGCGSHTEEIQKALSIPLVVIQDS
jgi:hypothetical protein